MLVIDFFHLYPKTIDKTIDSLGGKIGRTSNIEDEDRSHLKNVKWLTADHKQATELMLEKFDILHALGMKGTRGLQRKLIRSAKKLTKLMRKHEAVFEATLNHSDAMRNLYEYVRISLDKRYENQTGINAHGERHRTPGGSNMR
jgi:hypothetical protein